MVIDRSLRKLLEYFFRDFLVSQRGLSENAICSYKDTFKILTPWLISRTGKSSPSIDDFSLLLILDFLKYLEEERKNSVLTRNIRLAAIKSFFRMTYLLLPDTKKTFESMIFIPFKKYDKKLIHFFDHEDALKILKSINVKSPLGFRNYAITSLLYDGGLRATELTVLKIKDFDCEQSTLEIIGKGNKWRKIDLWPRTSKILEKYLKQHRFSAKPLYKDYFFLNQRGISMTRSGIYKLCQKQAARVLNLREALPSSKIQAVHSWRHSAAINMIRRGRSLLEVKTRMGHASFDTTAKYLGMDLTLKRVSMQALMDFSSRFIEEADQAIVAEWNEKQDVVDFINSL